ncbi:MAG: hypothetical protein EOO16_00360 [Chitinophagaceae bacterium]|nr:MAG: hypothetical protein EOO16_00360 [Chitinophagaceae bacterium]
MPHIEVIKANFLRRTYRSSGHDARFSFRITSIEDHLDRAGDFMFDINMSEVAGDWEFTQPWSVRKEIVDILKEKLRQWGLNPTIEPTDLSIHIANSGRKRPN